jgi:hypothetical protein
MGLSSNLSACGSSVLMHCTPKMAHAVEKPFELTIIADKVPITTAIKFYSQVIRLYFYRFLLAYCIFRENKCETIWHHWSESSVGMGKETLIGNYPDK